MTASAVEEGAIIRARYRCWILSVACLFGVEAHAFTVNTAPVGIANSAIAVDGAGIATVVWTIDDVPNTTPVVLGRRFDAAGDPVGPEYQVSTVQGLYVQTVDIAMNAAGASVVVWAEQVTGHYRIYARRYDALGVAQGGEIEVDGSEIYAPTLPSVAIDAAGGFLVVWNSLGANTDGIDDAVRARRYDAMGAPAGPAFAVNTSATQYPRADVAFTGVGYVVAWTGQVGGGTHAQRFDTSGNPVGAEIAVTGDVQGMSVASDGAGAFVLVASDQISDVYAWRYDANDVPLGVVPVSGTSGNVDSRVVMDATGAFMVVYQAQFGPPDDLEYRIRASRFDPSGTFVPPALELSLPGVPAFFPAVAFLVPDGFIATWTRDPYGSGSIDGLTWRPLTPVAGTGLRMRDAGDATRRTITLRLKDPLVSTQLGLGIDGVTNPFGVSVHVFNTQATGDAACFTLPMVFWTEKQTHTGRKLRYLDSSYASGPCKKAQVKPGELRLSCKAKFAPIPYTLDEPSQGGIGVAVQSGDATICAEFGGIKKDEPGSFTGVSAPRVTMCQTPPGPCPKSLRPRLDRAERPVP